MTAPVSTEDHSSSAENCIPPAEDSRFARVMVHIAQLETDLTGGWWERIYPDFRHIPRLPAKAPYRPISVPAECVFVHKIKDPDARYVRTSWTYFDHGESYLLSKSDITEILEGWLADWLTARCELPPQVSLAKMVSSPRAVQFHYCPSRYLSFTLTLPIPSTVPPLSWWAKESVVAIGEEKPVETPPTPITLRDFMR